MAYRSSNFSPKDIGKSELEKVIRYDEGTTAWWGEHTALGGQNNATIQQKFWGCAHLPPPYHQLLQFHIYLYGFQKHTIFTTLKGHQFLSERHVETGQVMIQFLTSKEVSEACRKTLLTFKKENNKAQTLQFFIHRWGKADFLGCVSILISR